MKIIKWLLWLVLFVVVVAIGGAVFLVKTVDPNDLKPQISQKVESFTGRKLDLTGDLSWRFYPWVGVTLNQFSLSNREGFSPQNMLEAEYVDVQLKLMPLLSKQIEVGKIKLQSPIINLSVNVDGETSWGDLAGSNGDGKGDGKGDGQTSPEQEAGAMMGGLLIQGVDISKGEIDWNDEQAGMRYHLSDFELVTDEIQPEAPIGFDLRTRLSGTDIPDAADIHLNGALRVSEGMDSIKLDYLSVATKMQEMAVKVDLDALSFITSTGEVLAKEMTADLKMPDKSANVAVNTISFSTKSNQALVERLVGSVVMDEIAVDIDAETIRYAVDAGELALKTIKYTGKHELASFDSQADGLNFDVNNNALSLSKYTLNATVEDLPVQLFAENIHMDLTRETLSLPKIELRSDDALLQANLDITALMGDLQASGHISSNTLNPRAMLEKLKLDALSELPEKSMQALSVETDFVAGLTGVALEKLTLALDQSQLSGQLSVQDFESPVARFDLDLDQINLDNYMSAEAKAVAESAGPAATMTAMSGAAGESNQAAGVADQVSTPVAMDELPFETLKGLDVKGRIDIGELRMQDLLSNDVVVQVDTANDRIQVSPLSAKAYGGETFNTLIYDISGDQPVMEIQSSLKTLHLGPFLQAMKITDRLEGFGGVEANIQSSGLNTEAVIAALNGKIDVQLKDGSIRGVSLQDALLKVESLYKQLKGKDLGLEGEASDKTEFSSFSSQIDINNGVLSTQDVNLMAPALRVTGGGTVDLNTEQLDLKLQVAVVASFEGQGGQTLENLKGLTIPIAISGSFDTPKIRPDMTDLAKQQLQQELSEKYLGGEKLSGDSFDEALKDQLNQKLNKELGLEPAESAPATEGQAAETAAPATQAPAESSTEQLKKDLKKKVFNKLFGG